MRAWMTRGLLLGLALLSACGGGADLKKAQVRLVNASSGYSALDMSIDDSRRFSSLAYGETANYVEAEPDKMESVISRPNAATALLTFTPTVSKNQHYTVMAYGGEGTLKTLTLDDNTGAPASGKTLLRVVNAAPDAGSLDVYVTASGDTLSEAVALQAAAEVGKLGEYVSVNSATWRLRVTAANSKADLRLDVSGLALGSQQVATLVITPGRGGVLVNALLLVDRGAVTRADGPQARVRVAAAVSSSGTVAATVGGVAVMPATGSPAVGLYSLVAAGTPALAVTVNGSAVSATLPTLAAGADYTLLVYGPPGAPLAAWVEDDNRLPSDSTKAKLRLVNGVSDLAATVSLTADFVPVAQGVAPGTGSAYALVSATTTADLSVTASGLASPIVSDVDKTFVAGSVYTYFVVGEAVPVPPKAVGILRPDR